MFPWIIPEYVLFSSDHLVQQTTNLVQTKDHLDEFVPFPLFRGHAQHLQQYTDSTREQWIVTMCAWETHRLQVARTLDTEPLEQPRNLVHGTPRQNISSSSSSGCRLTPSSVRFVTVVRDPGTRATHAESVQDRAVENLLGTRVHHFFCVCRRTFIVRVCPRNLCTQIMKKDLHVLCLK